MNQFREAYRQIHNSIRHDDYQPLDFITDIIDFTNDVAITLDDQPHRYYTFKYLKNVFFATHVDAWNRCRLVQSTMKKICSSSVILPSDPTDRLLQGIESIFTLDYSKDLFFLPYLVALLRKHEAIRATTILAAFTYALIDIENMSSYLRTTYYDDFESMIPEKDREVDTLQNLLYHHFIKLNDEIDEASDVARILFFVLAPENLRRYFTDYLLEFHTVISDKGIFRLDWCKPRWLDTYLRRHDLPGQPSATLQEIADAYRLSRQRIQQIDTKIRNKTALHVAHHPETTKDILYAWETPNRFPYMTAEDLLQSLSETSLPEEKKHYLIAILEDGLAPAVTYDDKYGIFYDPRVFEINEFKLFAINERSEADNNSSPEGSDKLTMEIRRRAHPVYGTSHKISRRKLLRPLIKTNFPAGIKLKQRQITADMKRLIELMQTSYGIVMNNNPWTFQATLIRMDFIHTGGGIYRPLEDCAVLSDELCNDILSYVDSHAPLVPYRLLFCQFKDRLHAAGIDNVIYLKQLLDRCIRHNPDYIHKRNYIRVGKGKQTLHQSIRKYMRTQSTAFPLKTLKRNFPGVPEFTFLQIIDRMKSIMPMGKNIFADIKILHIRDKDKDALGKLVDETISKTGIGAATAKKLYSELLIGNYELANRIRYISNDFRFFSLLKCLFPHEYAFRRPIIALDKTSLCSLNELPNRYARTLQRFSLDDIREQIQIQKWRHIENWSAFILSLQDTYIQIEEDLLVHKALLKLTGKLIEKIDHSVSYHINSFGCLDTRKYHGYFLLPRLEHPWNKYLLVSLIRTFLNDRFSIEHTDKTYNLTDYIIRRRNDDRT